MKTRNNIQLTTYAAAQIGRPYWFGTSGQTATMKLLDQKRKQYPKYYTAKDFEKQLGQKVHDCFGLVEGCLMSQDENTGAVYNAKYDISADMAISKCEKSGKLATLPEIPGLLLWKPGPAGVYLGNGKTVEAKGHKYGVVTTVDTAWQKWGMMSYWFDYITIDDFLTGLYINILNRDPDPSGFEFWKKRLHERKTDVSKVVIEFVNSVEFSMMNVPNEYFIRSLYTALFMRDPDPSGLAFWIDNAARYGRDFVLYGFLASHEWRINAEYYNIIC